MKRKLLMIILGGLAFFLGQGFIRLPLLNRLPLSWTIYFQLMPIIYWLFLGFSAGIAEEFTTFLLKRIGIKTSLRQEGFYFGVGRWICEVLILFSMAGFQLLSPLAYLERALVFFFQTGASMLIWKGFARGQKWRYLVYAIVIHGIFDASIGLWAFLKLSPWTIEGITALMSGWVFYLGWKGWKKNEKNNSLT